MFKQNKEPVSDIALDPPPTVHDIGSKYKFSDKAYFKKDRGSKDQDVEVIDRRKEDGKVFHFVWNRGLSNANLIDPFVREHKKGFTFYYARLAYLDEYAIECPELAFSDKRHTAIIGQVIREDDKLTDYSKLIIMEIKHEGDKLRIISAYERVIGFPRVWPYVDNIMRQGRKGKTMDIEGLEPGQLAEATRELFRRKKALGYDY